MPKNIVLLIGAVIVFAAAGSFYLNHQTRSQSVSKTTASESDKFSINDTLECNYTDAEGRVAKAFVKDGAVRGNIQSPIPAKSGSFIMKDNRLYYWNNGQGFIIDFTKPEGQSALAQKEQLMTNFEKYKQYCKRAAVSDNEFIPPGDVEFKSYAQGGTNSIQSISPAAGQYANPQ